MKICFWGNIARALKGSTDGGAELQIALIARALAIAGHEVVTIDYETTEDFITAEGIKVFRIKGWNNGIRIIRTFTHRLPQLYRSLKAQKADVYYCRIRDFRHILAFWAARKVKAKFILGMASDLDAMDFVMRLKYRKLVSFGDLWGFFNNILIEIVYPLLLRKADLILVQHEGQKDILLKNHHKSLIFLNLFELTESPVIQECSHEDFIYVGDLDKRKGFVKFFEIIKKSPSHSFKVVGQPLGKTGYLYYEKLKSYDNVTLFGRLNHSDTMYQIANSKALISTSPMEGFPNVFIEAWACGIPVLSLYVDPGAIIKKQELGEVTHGDMDKLIMAMDNNRNINEFAKRAKAYVENNHVLNTNKINEINSLFNELYINEKSKKNSKVT
jgi:glycosyltransferase involved in cell wall biosynthesis